MRTALTSSRLERTLTELDHVRLTRLLQRQPAEPAVIGELLDVAQVVPSRAVGPDVVTMYSQVLLQDVRNGQRSTLTLCYPADAEPEKGFISVLSPVGISLLGLRVGDMAKWQTPHGEECSATIESIQYQPEATGDYLT